MHDACRLHGEPSVAFRFARSAQSQKQASRDQVRLAWFALNPGRIERARGASSRPRFRHERNRRRG